MRLFSLPPSLQALIFDIDGTLYTNPGYMAFQEEILVEELARRRSEPVTDTRALLRRMREDREAAGLGKSSMGRLFAELGVDIPTSVAWRQRLIKPELWLGPDPRLDSCLAALAARFSLAVVTNNPRSVALAALGALGVARRFPLVVGLDDTMISKPAPEPFALAASRAGIAPEGCVSIGDRMDIDIAPALDMGMGGILVRGVEDVYDLVERLAC